MTLLSLPACASTLPLLSMPLVFATLNDKSSTTSTKPTNSPFPLRWSRPRQPIWHAQLRELSLQKLSLAALGKPLEQVTLEFKRLAERRVRLGLLFSEIARIEHISVTPADIEGALQQRIDLGGDPEQLRRHFNDPANRNELTGPLLEDKVTHFILSHADITDTPVKPAELNDYLFDVLYEYA